MEGIRLVHATLRGVLFCIEHPTRKLQYPMLCGRCSGLDKSVTHSQKTYHLQLDGEGAVIVSREVLARLEEIGLPLLGLRIENAVSRPPTQRFTLDGRTYTSAPPVVNLGAELGRSE